MSLKFCLISWCDQICSSSLHHGLAWQHTARMPGGNLYVLVVLKTCGGLGLRKRILIMSSQCARCGSGLLPGVWGEWGQHGGRGEGGPGPLEAGKISSQCPTKAGTTWGRMRRTNQVMKEDRVNRVNGLLIKLNFVNMTFKFFILIIVLSFRRINHMALRNHLHWSSVYLLPNIMSRTVRVVTIIT